jgi:hypothetical protein
VDETWIALMCSWNDRQAVVALVDTEEANRNPSTSV